MGEGSFPYRQIASAYETALEVHHDFSETTHKLLFQNIEAEEGVLNGGKATVKLFGVTEVRFQGELVVSFYSAN